MMVGANSFSHHGAVPTPSAANRSIAIKRSRPFRRNTQQQREIRQVFERTDRPLTADEILRLAQEKIAGLGIATVYRTIKALTNDGWLVPVEVPGASPRFEIRCKAHHHHFHCLKCRRLFELKGCVEHLGRMTPPTFQMVDHFVLIDGFCAECCRVRKSRFAAAQRNGLMRARRNLKGFSGSTS
jgi:Fur family transcriptional regulator, ferric uptake regulator